VKYAFDTNIFIDAFRHDEAHAQLLAFLNRALPFIYLNAVVMQELAAGARTADAVRALQHGIFEPFQRRRRIFAPSAAAFLDSGRAVAALALRERGRLAGHPALLNDALIAASCREHGVTLITRDRGFERLKPFLKGMRDVEPWPLLSVHP
jgi:predicted nucleic acid-binding protein